MVLPLLARLAGRALISGALDGSESLKNIPTPELEVSVTDNVKDVLSSLNELERQAIPKAVVRSLNRTVSSVNTQANRRIAKVMGTTFIITRERYIAWIEEIKQKVGFDKENVTAELERRLGL